MRRDTKLSAESSAASPVMAKEETAPGPDNAANHGSRPRGDPGIVVAGSGIGSLAYVTTPYHLSSCPTVTFTGAALSIDCGLEELEGDTTVRDWVGPKT